MNGRRILDIITEFSKKLPKFPDGRIDYSDSDVAPVITVFIMFRDKVLLLKRSNGVLTYKGFWNAVAGYLDEVKPLEEKALEEIFEETGIQKELIKGIKVLLPKIIIDKAIDKTWIVNVVLAELKALPEILLDFEHTEYKWILPEEIVKFKTVPKLEEGLKRALNGSGS